MQRELHIEEITDKPRKDPLIEAPESSKHSDKGPGIPQTLPVNLESRKPWPHHLDSRKARAFRAEFPRGTPVHPQKASSKVTDNFHQFSTLFSCNFTLRSANFTSKSATVVGITVFRYSAIKPNFSSSHHEESFELVAPTLLEAQYEPIRTNIPQPQACRRPHKDL